MPALIPATTLGNPLRPTYPFPRHLTSDGDDRAVRLREAEALRVELRRVVGRVNFRRRRGQMFVALLLLTLAAILTVAVFMLSPTEWLISQQSRFTQMITLVFLIIVATPLAAYFAGRYDRQRERVRIARMRQREILQRLAELDDETGQRRRGRRRRKRTWAWHVNHPVPFSRPPLETLAGEALEEAADTLGAALTEEQGLRALAYLHAGITGALTAGFAFVVTLSGPQYLTDFLSGKRWGGAVGPDPLMFWLTLTIGLVIFGGLGTHRVSVLLRRARAYDDRTRAIERALWDARVLLRERREEV